MAALRSHVPARAGPGRRAPSSWPPATQRVSILSESQDWPATHLVTTLLEALDDLADEAALDAVGLDHDVGCTLMSVSLSGRVRSTHSAQST